MSARDFSAWAAPFLAQPFPQPRDPVEDESLDWSTDNEWQEQCEERAYADMDAHAPRWIDWLIHTADSHDVALYASYAMAAHVVNADSREDAIIARGQQAEMGDRLRKDYIDYLVEND